jgi:hypothetical protein
MVVWNLSRQVAAAAAQSIIIVITNIIFKDRRDRSPECSRDEGQRILNMTDELFL